MAPDAHGEAAALAAMFPAAARVHLAEPPALPRPDGARLVRWRVAATILVSCVLLFPMLIAVGTGASGLPLWAQAIVLSTAMIALAWSAARVAGAKLVGLGPRAARWSAAGAAIGLGGVAWCLLSLALANRLAADGAGAPAGLLALGFGATAAQAAAEEVFFRGWVQAALTRVAPWGVAFALAATAFALLHATAGALAPFELVNALLAGAVFGLLAQASGGLAAPIAAHAGWNVAEVVLFGASPNPGAGPWGALWGRDIVGTAIWGGGESGLNASILTTVVLAATALACVPAARRRGQPA